MNLFHRERAAHAVLKELQEEANDNESLLNQRGQHRKQELLRLIQDLQHELEKLDAFILKYRRHTRAERRIYNQFKLATEKLSKFRGRLIWCITAINAFMESLSRGTLARIEVVLLELVKEVREGRRPPSIASIDNEIDDPVWRELEAELAEDGISSMDVSKHKSAIRVFLQNLLSSSHSDTVSLYEVASMVESRNDTEDAEPHVQSVPTHHASSAEAYRNPKLSGDDASDASSSMSADSSQYDSAVEDMQQEINEHAVPRISFAASSNAGVLESDTTKVAETIDRRLEQLTPGNESTRSMYSHRHSVDASTIGPRQMVLMLDPTHSCENNSCSSCTSLTYNKLFPNLRMLTFGL